MNMKYKDTWFYKIIRPIMTILFKIIYRPEIINKEYIPNAGKVILAGNHVNNFDCLLLLSSTKRQIHFLAKNSLMKGIKKILFKNLGIIPVNRSIKDKSVIPITKKYLDNDLVVGIFPEATTEKNERRLLPFKIGTVKISYETDTFIVPFKIMGEYRLLKKGLKLIFDKPIKAKEDLEISNKKLYDIINSIGCE